jgi:hypothetical protein
VDYETWNGNTNECIVLGHREFGLGTGQIIPVLVKAEKIQGTPPPVKDAPWDPVTSCTEPPAARTLL